MIGIKILFVLFRKKTETSPSTGETTVREMISETIAIWSVVMVAWAWSQP